MSLTVRRFSLIAGACLSCLAAFAQTPAAQGTTSTSTATSTTAVVPHGVSRAADPTARYYRLICLVHLAGSGKKDDPIRPEYVPTAVDAARQGILSWSFQLTDDKSMAIVHMVASNPHAFDPVFADARPEVKVFEIGKDSRATIEAEMQKHVKGFDLSKFTVVAR